MKFYFNNLQIYTEKKIITKIFSSSITFYHGPTSVGKSTILRIIDYCLGNELDPTEEIQKEFKKAVLDLQIGNHHVILEREYHHNQIIANYEDESSHERFSLKIPVFPPSDESLIPNMDVFNFTDFLFYLCGLKPPFVRRGHDDEIELIRLSFRDLMWYCYLTQDEMTSSFFYLERADDYNRHRKSREVLRYVLKYQIEKISKLEDELHNQKQNQIGIKLSISQLEKFLDEKGIENLDALTEEQAAINNEIDEIERRLSSIRENMDTPLSHTLDNLRREANQLSVFIQKIRNVIDDVELRIIEQSDLRSEFVMTNMKIKRTNTARRVFKDVEFNRCPQCGEPITKITDEFNCSLCTKPLHSGNVLDAHISDLDLESRIKEIENSIAYQKEQKHRLEIQLESNISLKEEIDKKIDEQSKNYDSRFLAETRDLLTTKGILEGKLGAIAKLLPLPSKIDELRHQHDKISQRIEQITILLKTEREKVRHENLSLGELRKLFKETLLRVKFPNFIETDEISINPFTFYPQIRKKKGNIDIILDFNNLGSGGMKNIFKTCFAIALHRLSTKSKGNLPSFMMIDTPMTNLSENEDMEIFQSFYRFIYELFSTELKGQQLIVIDKEYHEPSSEIKDLTINEERMDKNNPLF